MRAREHNGIMQRGIVKFFKTRRSWRINRSFGGGEKEYRREVSPCGLDLVKVFA